MIEKGTKRLFPHGTVSRNDIWKCVSKFLGGISSYNLIVITRGNEDYRLLLLASYSCGLNNIATYSATVQPTVPCTCNETRTKVKNALDIKHTGLVMDKMPYPSKKPYSWRYTNDNVVLTHMVIFAGYVIWAVVKQCMLIHSSRCWASSIQMAAWLTSGVHRIKAGTLMNWQWDVKFTICQFPIPVE